MSNLDVSQVFAGICPGINWRRAYAEAWPISFQPVVALSKLYMPWYLRDDGTPGQYNQDRIRPVTLGEVAEKLNIWGDDHQTRVENLQRSFQQSFPDKLLFPAYQLQRGNLLLLDGNHRALALIKSNLLCPVQLVVIHGPLEENALLDMKAFNNYFS